MDINSALSIFERNDNILIILNDKKEIVKGEIVSFTPKLCISTGGINLTYIDYENIFAILEDKENKKYNFTFKE